MFNRVLLSFLLFSSVITSLRADSLTVKQKKLIVFGGAALGYSGSLILLNEAWYKDYPRSSFHFFNDNGSWLQIDKLGHAYTSYAYGLAGIECMKWTGMERKKAIWIGGLAGTLFQTPIEILDGFSAEWGASPGDLVANSLGSAAVISQALLWDEQRIQLKFSAFPSPYREIRPNTLGGNPIAGILKDYNGQTYWLSSSPGIWLKNSSWPKWLQFSMGYGATGMLGGEGNVWTSSSGQIFDYSGVRRERQYYLSLDVDISRIPVRHPFWQRVLRCATLIKIPAPALEMRSGGFIKFHPVYF